MLFLITKTVFQKTKTKNSESTFSLVHFIYFALVFFFSFAGYDGLRSAHCVVQTIAASEQQTVSDGSNQAE